MDESCLRFTFHSKHPQNLFNKSRNVFENAAKGMYSSNTSRITNKLITNSLKIPVKVKNPAGKSRTRRSSLYKNNVIF